MDQSRPAEVNVGTDISQENKIPAADKTEGEAIENYETITDLVELIEGIGTEEITKITESSKKIIAENSDTEIDKKRRFAGFSDVIAKEITTRALNMIARQGVPDEGEMSLVTSLATGGNGAGVEDMMDRLRQSMIEFLGLKKYTRSEETAQEDRHGTPIIRKSEISYYDFPKPIDDGSMELSELVKMIFLESYGLTRETQKICESIISGKIRAQLAK